MTGLVLYERMVTSIAACEKVDEAKAIRDKAIALRAYYRQSQNVEAERQAVNIRLRAERQAGILLKQLARAAESKGGDVKSASARAKPIQPSPYARTLTDTGMSLQQASRFQALAEVPAADFEAALAGPEVPTATRIAARAKVEEARLVDVDGSKPRVTSRALWVWGTLCDFRAIWAPDPHRHSRAIRGDDGCDASGHPEACAVGGGISGDADPRGGREW